MSWIGCVFTNLERQALEGLGLVENFQLQVTQGFGQQLSYIFSRHFPRQLYFWAACQPSCSTACWLISSTTFLVKKKGRGVEGEHIAIYFECRWIDLSLTVSVGSDNESSDNNEESESDDSSTTDSSDSSDDSSSSSSPSSSSGDNSSKSSNSEESDSHNERKSKKLKSKKRWADARRANMRATKHENHTTLLRG